MATAKADAMGATSDRTGLLLDFLGSLELERGLARNTLEAYRTDLLQLFGHLGSSGIDPLDARRSDLTGWLDGLAESGASNATLRRKLACLRTWYRWLRREELVDSDPTADIRPAGRVEALPKVLSRGEVSRLLANPKGNSSAALRDRALLETMYACGLRSSEAVGMELSRLDLDGLLIRVEGKGGKERIVPIGSAAAKALREWLEYGRPRLVGIREERRVFVNLRGGALTRQGLHGIVRRHARESGLEGRMTPHTLRHTFATHLLAGGCDLRVLQELLGHADASTTQMYTHLTAEDLRDKWFDAHPRARG